MLSRPVLEAKDLDSAVCLTTGAEYSEAHCTILDGWNERATHTVWRRPRVPCTVLAHEPITPLPHVQMLDLNMGVSYDGLLHDIARLGRAHVP